MSSCHQVRQKDTIHCMLFRMELCVGHKVSLVLACPHPFLVCLWNVGEDNPETCIGRYLPDLTGQLGASGV